MGKPKIFTDPACLTIRIDRSQREQIHQIAHADGRSVGEIIREMIDDLIEEREKHKDIRT